MREFAGISTNSMLLHDVEDDTVAGIVDVRLIIAEPVYRYVDEKVEQKQQLNTVDFGVTRKGLARLIDALMVASGTLSDLEERITVEKAVEGRDV